MDRDDTHIDTAKQAEFMQRITDAKAELKRVGSDTSSPGHIVWAAQAEVDRLEHEYDAYLQAFAGRN